MSTRTERIHTRNVAKFGATAVRVKRDVIDDGYCSGLDDIRTETSEGVAHGYNGVVQYLLSDEPSKVKSGGTVEVKRISDEDYLTVRVAVRHVIDGVVRLTVAAEFA